MKEKIISTIKKYETIIIHRHIRPDPDAYGSQGGLKELIKETYPDKKVYVVGEEDPSLHFLLRMDDISDETYKNALVIVCDTANVPRISDDRYRLGKKLIKIDHHPDESPYGDLSWVDTNASSTSEMIYELYLAGKDENFQLNDKAARLLYAGIVGDTGRFLFPNTRSKTFEYVTDLITYSFDRTKLYHQMYETSEHIERLRGHILQNFVLTENGMCAITITEELMEKYNVSSSETGQLVNTVSNVSGIKAWAFFIEEEDLIRVRLRSKGPIINQLASQFNGGGHALAAGASVQSWEEATELQNALDLLCKKYNSNQ